MAGCFLLSARVSWLCFMTEGWLCPDCEQHSLPQPSNKRTVSTPYGGTRRLKGKNKTKSPTCWAHSWGDRHLNIQCNPESHALWLGSEWGSGSQNTKELPWWKAFEVGKHGDEEHKPMVMKSTGLGVRQTCVWIQLATYCLCDLVALPSPSFSQAKMRIIIFSL